MPREKNDEKEMINVMIGYKIVDLDGITGKMQKIYTWFVMEWPGILFNVCENYISGWQLEECYYYSPM